MKRKRRCKLNPKIYFFEIQNKKADGNTTFEDFIKDANLTYLGYGESV